MDIYEFEYITCDFDIAINSMDLLLNTFENFLDDKYCEVAKDNKNVLFKDLRSYEFLFKQMSKNFRDLQKKYQEQIEFHFHGEELIE